MSDWFLPTAQRPWTAGNLVVPHVHGADYFARLLEVIGATESGDRIYFTDWRGDADERMADDGPTIADVLTAAGRRGVEVRALLWRSHPGKLRGKQHNHLGAAVNESGGEALLDERVRRGGSHHQKLFVVRRRGRPEQDVAFVGGIDLCHGRRDDAAHAGDPQAPPLDERYGATPPWHDATAEIRGPAVAHVLDTFAERWDDPTPLDHRNPYRAVLHRLVRMPRHPQPLPQRWDPPPEAGSHQVQILRTYPAKHPAYPFAPNGERSIALAYSRAFSRARRLVYIEDQYFWSDVVADALAEALRREPELPGHRRRPPVPRGRHDVRGTADQVRATAGMGRPAQGRRGPRRTVRPPEPLGHTGLRARQGVRRRRPVDDHRLRQPQPALLDPRLRAHVRGGRPCRGTAPQPAHPAVVRAPGDAAGRRAVV